MILAENFKLKESLLFLLSMRETLCLLIDESNISYRKELKSFIINEASDYQIVSLILDGELPLNETHHFNELVLFERIRIEVKENKNLVCEMFGLDIFDDVSKKVDSVSPKFSTRKPLLEVDDDNPYSIKNMLKNAGKPSTKVMPSKYKIDPKIKDMLDSAKKEVDKHHASFDLKPKADISSVSKTIPKIIPQQTRSMPLVKGDVNIIPQRIKSTPAPTHDIVKKTVGLRAQITKSFNDLKHQATSATNATTSFVKAHPAEIAGVMLAVLAIYASVKIYKRFYSQAARSCSIYKGQKKTICMKKFQLTGYKAQLMDLKKASTKCGLTKDPEKCVRTIKNKMDKINKKISKAV